MRGAVPPLPQYVLMAWCLVKHRDFAFTEYFRTSYIATLRFINPVRSAVGKCNTLLNYFTYLLILLWRILFEKLIVTQLVEKYSTSLWNPKVHYRDHKSPPPHLILSQPNPVRPIDPYLPKVQLNVILPPTPRSSQWSLPFGPPNQNPVNTSPLPNA
jgi:hypothetical protein